MVALTPLIFYINGLSLTHIVAALDQESQRHVPVPRDRPQTNVGGNDAVRHAIGHSSVAVSVSPKRNSPVIRVFNTLPGARCVSVCHLI